LPPAGIYLAIAALAALENVFPPVPADTAAALGAFLAARNPSLNVWIVYAVTVGANVSSATGMFFFARRVGPAFLKTKLARRLLPEHAVATVRDEYERHHVWGIFVSRFLPVYRAIVPPFAGMMGVSAARAIPAMAAASAIFYGLVVWLAYRLGKNWEAVRHGLGDLGIALAAGALIVTVLLVRRLLQKASATRA
jgi:membrane protein DedA with SNARE-associated domain